MKKVFLDLEMNPVPRTRPELRALLAQEVIEFGAVMYDERGRRTGSFREFVRPQYNDRIEPAIANLTGITYDMVCSADPFSDVLDRFLGWCGSSCRLYCWSENDALQLRAETESKCGQDAAAAELAGRLESCLDGWLDVQQLFGERSGFGRIMKLDLAVHLLGVEFVGRQHDALTDAQATADLYFELFHGEAIRIVRSVMAPEMPAFGTALGGLLAGLQLA